MKFYKFLKKFATYAKDAEVELDPGHQTTLDYLDAGIIEEVPGTSVDAIADRVASKIMGSLDGAMTKAASKGPRVDLIAAEADKTKSLGDQVRQIAILSSPESNQVQVQKAAERLEKVYNSTFNQWSTKASTQVENSGPLGGYGVYPEYSQEIYRIAIESTDIAAKCRQVTMSTNDYRFPKLDQTGTQAANQTGYIAGVVAGWSSETNTGSQTNAKLKQGILKAGELKGYTVLSNELLQDNTVGFEAEIKSLFAEAIAYYLDLAILVGDGVDKPVGIKNAPCTLTTGPNAGGRTTASTVKYADLAYLVGLMLPQSMKTAMWVFNQTVKSTLLQLQDGASRNIWLPNIPGSTAGSVAYGGGPTLLDLPYMFTEKTPVLGSAGDVMIVDPKGYMVGRRMSLEIAASPHVNFLANEMTYRFIARIGGQPILDKAFTMIDGTNQLSTFVALN